MRSAATTLALALAGLFLLGPAPSVEAKGLRMTLEATGEQLLHAAQEASGLDPHEDDVVSAVLLCMGWVRGWGVGGEGWI